MHAPARWRRQFHGIGVEGITEEHVQNELRAGKGYFYKVQEEKANRTCSSVFMRT